VVRYRDVVRLDVVLLLPGDRVQFRELGDAHRGVAELVGPMQRSDGPGVVELVGPLGTLVGQVRRLLPLVGSGESFGDHQVLVHAVPLAWLE